MPSFLLQSICQAFPNAFSHFSEPLLHNPFFCLCNSSRLRSLEQMLLFLFSYIELELIIKKNVSFSLALFFSFLSLVLRLTKRKRPKACIYYLIKELKQMKLLSASVNKLFCHLKCLSDAGTPGFATECGKYNC